MSKKWYLNWSGNRIENSPCRTSIEVRSDSAFKMMPSVPLCEFRSSTIEPYNTDTAPNNSVFFNIDTKSGFCGDFGVIIDSVSLQ